jgi:hypothetical protein
MGVKGDFSAVMPTRPIMAGVMLPPQKWRLLFVLAVTCLVPILAAEPRDVSHGKRGSCQGRINGPGTERLGAPSWSCGTQGYTRVFTGTVRSAADASETETRLELIPDEVFLGDAGELTATVNQACLLENQPEIKAGDKWLFYVRPKRYFDNETRQVITDGLEVSWYSPSKPVSEAEDDIAALRHLAGLTDKGMLTGSVIRIGATVDTLNPTAVPDHRVVATSVQSGAEYTAFTNGNGHFEVELPPGSYDVTASTKQGLRDAEPFIPDPLEVEYGFRGNAHVSPRGCTEIAFRLLVDGKLAGRVTAADGRPASFAKVAIVPISPVRPQFTVNADENGYFEVSGRQPGQYVIGVGLLAPFGSAEWQSRVYYPGVRTRGEARVIELGEGELRTDIDFQLLPSSAVH